MKISIPALFLCLTFTFLAIRAARDKDVGFGLMVFYMAFALINALGIFES